MSSIIMPDDGRPDRGVVPSITAIEIGLNKILPAGNIGGLDSWVDGKIKTAIEVMQLVSKTQGERKPYEPFKKPILESKALQDVGQLSDSKSYRNFNRKMRNAMEQTRPWSRAAIEYIEKIKEKDIMEAAIGLPGKKVIDVILTIFEDSCVGDPALLHTIDEDSIRDLDRDLWSILTAKADGEALSKLKSVNQGEGLWAYIRIHHWFSRTTDQGKNARRLAIMDPPQCKHDHEISQAIEEWEERYRILKDEDKESELPESWRMTALKKILCGDIKKHIELREEEIKGYDELRKIIMNWAVNKKLEKSKHDPMDIGGVDGEEPLYPVTELEELTKLLDAYNVSTGGFEDEEGEDIDAVSKGKGRGKGQKGYQGKGKGKGGQSTIQALIAQLKAMKTAPPPINPHADKECGNCGKKGHIARDCRKPIVETRTCNRCGKAGHVKKDCKVRINSVEEGEPEAESLGEAGIIEWGINAVEWSCMPCDPLEANIRFGSVDLVDEEEEETIYIPKTMEEYHERASKESLAYQTMMTALDEKEDIYDEMVLKEKISAERSARIAATNAENDILGEIFPVEPNLSGAWETMQLKSQGLEPGYRKKIKDGYRLTFVMDSGAVKTIVPPDALPKLDIKKTANTGKTFRVANGQEIPNLGETIITGTNPTYGGRMKFTSQVAGIVKPLASANEMVDAGNLILLYREGGAIKKLTPEDLSKILKIIRDAPGAVVPIRRQAGSFNVEIDIKDDPTGVSDWTMAKKTVRPKDQLSKMEVDFISRNTFDDLSKEEIVSGFQRLFG